MLCARERGANVSAEADKTARGSERSPFHADSAVKSTDAASDRASSTMTSRTSNVRPTFAGTGNEIVATNGALQATSNTATTAPQAVNTMPSATNRRASWKRLAPSA